MKQGKTVHVPVMLDEAMTLLNLQPGMSVVDATLGGGGYTRAILERIGPTGQLIAIDWDKVAIERFLETASEDRLVGEALKDGRLHTVQASYSELMKVLEDKGWSGADAIVADLGLSSDQLSDKERGISFQTDGPLDMRLNTNETVEARHILNQMREEALADLFETYGDEGEAKRIATAIVVARKKAPLETTAELRDLVWKNVVPARRKGKVHPATKVFQALRIAVNSERTHLESFLVAIPTALVPLGRAVIVSFHSGEDSIVKHLFQKEIRSENSILRWVEKKALAPKREEIQRNPRARSAKLRTVEHC